MADRAPSPKKKFVDTALELFSDRGYFGVSLADVAGELGLTKQSVIYHFQTKDALYGAVIADIAARLDGIMDGVLSASSQDRDTLALLLERMHHHMQDKPQDARLVTRELLDNLDRTRTGNRWYLRDFLDRTVALVAEHPKWRDLPEGEQTATAYQLIGAVSYFAISGATLGAIWGEERLRDVEDAFLPALLLQTSE